jgi:3-oxoacyl-[acyl-carrier-protein] synthase II
MGEGAGMVVLEEYEHAKARGATIYAEILGYGLSGDAYHITAPPPDHEGGGACDARGAEARGAAAVGYRLCQRAWHLDHGRHDRAGRGGTADGRSCGSKLMMSSTKSMTGHLLGAAGAIEAIFAILAIRDQDRAADDQPRQPGGGDPDQPLCECRSEG